MSFSMWAWRVIVPGGGLVACALVLWASLPANGRGGTPAAAAKPVRQVVSERVVAEGRIVARPGAEVNVGTETGGLIVDLLAREKVRVRKGDVLIRLRSTDQQFAVADAEARLAEADAEFEFQKSEFKRRAQAPLDSKRFSAEVDSGRRDYEAAAARRRIAVVLLERSRAALTQTRVTAPIDGVVLTCHVQAGETAAPGARLVTVCDLSRTRVEAEVDEFDAQRVSLGDSVTITAEGHSPASWPGTVEEVPDLVSGRTIRPQDPGQPTDTGVLLVKIAPADPLPLKLGQQVELTIHPQAIGSPAGPRGRTGK